MDPDCKEKLYTFLRMGELKSVATTGFGFYLNCSLILFGAQDMYILEP